MYSCVFILLCVVPVVVFTSLILVLKFIVAYACTVWVL